MFYSLTGRLIQMEPGMLAVECGGVAFKCFTSMHTQKNMPRIGEVTTVYTHLNVREDALDLFGFASKSELNCFKMLTGISGVGPKVALAILSEMTPEGVAMAAASGRQRNVTSEALMSLRRSSASLRSAGSIVRISMSSRPAKRSKMRRPVVPSCPSM